MQTKRLVGRSICTLGLIFLNACGGASDNSQVQALLPPKCGISPNCNTPVLKEKAEGFVRSSPDDDAWHFGKDFFFNETEDQWVIAKFQYGNYFFRKPLVGEKVEIQLLRTCGGVWEKLGSATTSSSGQHLPVLEVDDDGGMVYFKIPEAKKLGLGRHRVRLVVSGDQSATELYIEVLPQGASLFVSDVDGTLTTSELIEGVSSIFGTVPPAHEGAATALQGLFNRGYHPIYLTARSTNLVQRTRDFITSRKFPAGMVMTSSATTFGLSGSKGVEYKTGVLKSLEDRGFKVAYAFGNSKVDTEAFANTNIPNSNKYFYNFDGNISLSGGQSFQSYTNLDLASQVENLCK